MNTRLNNIYCHMKRRCYNPNHPAYKNYGARGIKICAEWLEPKKGWKMFKEWALNNGYAPDLSIDRINNDKGYSPDNCRWTSRLVQANNKSDNRYVTYKGQTKSLAVWCRELGLNYGRVEARLYKCHWPVKKAFESKENTRLKMITYKGKRQCMKDWCNELGLSYKKIKDRLGKYHWSAERAFETK